MKQKPENQPWNHLGSEFWDHSQVWDELWSQLWSQLDDQLNSQLREALRETET